PAGRAVLHAGADADDVPAARALRRPPAPRARDPCDGPRAPRRKRAEPVAAADRMRPTRPHVIAVGGFGLPISRGLARAIAGAEIHADLDDALADAPDDAIDDAIEP